MDLAIDYSSPAIYSCIIIAFVTFFTLFRNYRFRLNTIFSALGFTGIVWSFLLYLLPQSRSSGLTVYFLVFGNLLLFFVFLLLHHLDELPTRKTRVIPVGSVFFPSWVNLVFGTLITFLGLGFFAYLVDKNGLFSFPENISALALNSVISFSLVFCASATLVTIISVFRLIKKLYDEKITSFEKTFSVIFGLLWSVYSLVFLAAVIKTYSAQTLDPQSVIANSDQLNFLPFLITASLGIILVLAVIVNRRYFVSYKVAITQLIASLIVMFNLVSLLNASNVEEIVLRLILVIVLAGLSHLLVRSVVSEIQKRKKIQDTTQEIYAANKALTRLDKAKSDFIASASHQLRSPLSVVKGIASMLLDGSYGKITGSVKDALEKVYISNERLIGLIESLLDISHLEEGRVEFTFAKIDLNAIAQKAADGLALQAQNKKLYLKLKPCKKSKLLVWADESKVTEAISNLVDNALKYTRKGGVTVELKKIGSTARVTVRDTGIGLRKEEIGNLFQKFVRTGRGNKMSTVGTGLGLYVVRKMIEAHKGKIYAESPGESRGSSFIIELPLDLKNPPDEKFIKRVVMEKQPA
ncbi:MAG: HAMP domain-containing sensor histidine kinase [Candidatus Moraniibacteriota bacterium]